MRVLHVAWEYPPLIYGGLGRHVDALTRDQAHRGDHVTVLTQSEDEDLTSIDVSELEDAPDVATTGVDRLTQAFPGAVLVDEGDTTT